MPDDPRPVWYLARGGCPVPASSRRLPAEAAYWCREGDAEWQAIEAKPAATARPVRTNP